MVGPPPKRVSRLLDIDAALIGKPNRCGEFLDETFIRKPFAGRVHACASTVIIMTRKKVIDVRHGAQFTLVAKIGEDRRE